MRKLLAVHILCTFIFAQELFDITKYDNGDIQMIKYYKKVGKKIELSQKEYYYKDGSIKYEGSYRKDKKDDRWNYYYEDGKLKKVGNFKAGQKIGKWTHYHDNGKVYSTGSYTDIYIEGGGDGDSDGHRDGKKVVLAVPDSPVDNGTLLA